jgi:hypothetical protein
MDPTPSPVIEERPARRRGLRGGSIWTAIILITLGVIFFLQNIGALGERFNWWALFILIPAFGAFATAWAGFERGGRRFNAIVRINLGGGAILLTVAFMFLFNANWAVWWPLMLIVPGLSMLIQGLPHPATQGHPSVAGLLGMNFWIGGSVVLLGLTFLLNGLGIISLHAIFGDFSWWGLFILIPGLGAFINAFLVVRGSGGKMTPAAWTLLAGGLATCSVAAVALLGWDWNLLAPIIMIAAGAVLLIAYLTRRAGS